VRSPPLIFLNVVPKGVGQRCAFAQPTPLIFTAAQIETEEAPRIGLAERVVDDAQLEQTVTELAEHIAAQPPLAVRHAKRAINAALDLSVREGVRLEATGQSVCLRSDDFKEAIRAFTERRTPRYQGR
jgi:enoyl-CoA hydratase